ncbi:MAG: radical SAM protein, partial [Candidatus Latescibacteria bacterium]|nr:radical SAM protein [bacterium]MBD3423452.1 radical SAM protein [Candidatus Latescibacterota bacterium]
RIFYDQSGGGVTISGGEPMGQPEFLEAFLILCKEHGLSTVLDTSGFCEYDSIAGVADLVDCFYYDLKLANPERHSEVTGVSNQPILRNLKKLDRAGAGIVPRFALIPGFTDSDENIMAIAGIISGLDNTSRVGIIPYNRMCRDKSARFGLEDRMKDMPENNEGSLARARRLFEDHGLIAESED